jgi:hypothetical protein
MIPSVCRLNLEDTISFQSTNLGWPCASVASVTAM